MPRKSRSHSRSVSRRKIHVGPNGGKYIMKSGEKVYLTKKSASRRSRTKRSRKSLRRSRSRRRSRKSLKRVSRRSRRRSYRKSHRRSHRKSLRRSHRRRSSAYTEAQLAYRNQQKHFKSFCAGFDKEDECGRQPGCRWNPKIKACRSGHKLMLGPARPSAAELASNQPAYSYGGITV